MGGGYLVVQEMHKQEMIRRDGKVEKKRGDEGKKEKQRLRGGKHRSKRRRTKRKRKKRKKEREKRDICMYESKREGRKNKTVEFLYRNRYLIQRVVKRKRKR